MNAGGCFQNFKATSRNVDFAAVGGQGLAQDWSRMSVIQLRNVFRDENVGADQKGRRGEGVGFVVLEWESYPTYLGQFQYLRRSLASIIHHFEIEEHVITAEKFVISRALRTASIAILFLSSTISK